MHGWIKEIFYQSGMEVEQCQNYAIPRITIWWYASFILVYTYSLGITLIIGYSLFIWVYTFYLSNMYLLFEYTLILWVSV